MATWRGEVNKALILSGQASISSDGTFNTDGNLDKVQLQAKYAYQRAYMRIWREGRWRFNEREFSISAVDGTSDYNVDTTTAPEYFVEASFRITSPTAAAKAPLTYVRYEDYVHHFPAGNGSGEGPPDYYILLPPDGTGVDKIRFYPTPGSSYTIKYRAYLQPTELTAGDSTIVFPAAMQDILLEFCQVYVESLLGEGKQADFATLLEPALSAAKAIYRGPVDEKSRLNMSMRVEGRRLGTTWVQP